jgi:hypothetical protein
MFFVAMQSKYFLSTLLNSSRVRNIRLISLNYSTYQDKRRLRLNMWSKFAFICFLASIIETSIILLIKKTTVPCIQILSKIIRKLKACFGDFAKIYHWYMHMPNILLCIISYFCTKSVSLLILKIGVHDFVVKPTRIKRQNVGYDNLIYNRFHSVRICTRFILKMAIT